MSPPASPPSLSPPSGDLAALLKTCIHCGMCLPTCPTYRVSGSEAESPRGRLYMMQGWLNKTPDITAEAITPHLDNCLACHACETACPSGVNYGEILFTTRETLAKNTANRSIQRRLARWLNRWVFQQVLPKAWIRNSVRKALSLLDKTGGLAVLRALGHLMKPVAPSLHASLDLLEPVRSHLPSHKPLLSGSRFGEPDKPLVCLMTGCVMDMVYNRIHWETIHVLVKNGYQVVIPKQTCCGALAYHAGETDITRALAKENVATVLAENPAHIVLNSAGCASTLKDYGHLLAEDPHFEPQAQLFAEKVVDVLALLAQKPLATFPRSLSQTVTYHAACHLHHAMGVQQAPLELLSLIPGLTLLPLTDAASCCGSAGIYNLTHPVMADAVLVEKLKHLKRVVALGAQVVTTANPGCLMQLEKGVRSEGIPLQVRHPVSLLAEAYGY